MNAAAHAAVLVALCLVGMVAFVADCQKAQDREKEITRRIQITNSPTTSKLDYER